MAAGELQLFDVNNKKNDDLLAIIARTRPDCSILCHDNQYSFSTSDLQELIVTNKTISPRVLSYAYGEMLRVNTARRSLLKPSICRRTLTRRARYLSRYSRKYRPSASSVYYTTDIRSLRDLVLYWHIALGHKGEEEMIRIVQHRLVTNLPEQLTVAVIRKYFRQIPRCKPCAEATLQRLPSPPSSTSPRPPMSLARSGISTSTSSPALPTLLVLFDLSLATHMYAMLSMPGLTVCSVFLQKVQKRS